MKHSSYVILFFVLAVVCAIIALANGQTSSSEAFPEIPEAGVACGFAVAAGLCVVAAAIALLAGARTKPEQ